MWHSLLSLPASGTLITAISLAAPIAHATAVCGPEKDTRGCPNPQEKEVVMNAIQMRARACVTTPPCIEECAKNRSQPFFFYLADRSKCRSKNSALTSDDHRIDV